MALVRVTGNLWSHGRLPVTAEDRPKLALRPDKPHMLNGLQHSVDVPCTLNPTTGYWFCDVESIPGLLKYQPVLSWFTDRVQQYTDFELWPAFDPGNGGDISDLIIPAPSGTIVARLGPPPPAARGIVWIDLTDVTSEGALVYAPERI